MTWEVGLIEVVFLYETRVLDVDTRIEIVTMSYQSIVVSKANKDLNETVWQKASLECSLLIFHFIALADETLLMLLAHVLVQLLVTKIRLATKITTWMYSSLDLLFWRIVSMTPLQ